MKYRLLRWEKIAALTFHISFIIILIGSAITRYISYEGMMHIREGDSTNLFISDDTFLKIHIDDKVHQYKYEKNFFYLEYMIIVLILMWILRIMTFL